MVLLCIDDDPEDVELFCDAINTINTGVNCVVAHNGKEGIDLLQTLRPDLIFLDLNMPVMDGRETLKRIRNNERLKKIPVYIFSTTSNTAEIEECKKLGADNCITKPNSFKELCSALQDVFEYLPATESMIEDRTERTLLSIAHRLRELRKQKGYSSQEDFALDHDLPRIQYWRLERGKANFTIRTLLKLLSIHNLTIEEFFCSLPETTVKRKTAKKS
jgi:CheY-like chemotaxis protein/DNA-binding XRE family transcriptional regulator